MASSHSITIRYTETAVTSTVADLTGTKWVLNRNLGTTTPAGTEYSYGIGHSFNEYYSLNFASNSNNYAQFWFRGLGEGGETQLRYSSTIVNGALSADGGAQYWEDEAYRIIEITDGVDATNSTLIAWLYQNAELQEEPQANTYEITHSLTNISHGNISIQITPDTGYTYPSGITVTNGTLVSYDSTTGVAIINGDDNTVVRAECAKTALINFSIVFHSKTYSYQAEMDMTWTDFANSSYNTNNDITVNGSTVSYKDLQAQVYIDSSLRHYVDPADTITTDFTYYAGQGN